MIRLSPISRGDYPGALASYERGIVPTDGEEEHNNSCKAGIARTAIRCGDARRGVNIAMELGQKQLKRDCADILESKKVFYDDNSSKWCSILSYVISTRRRHLEFGD